MIESFTKAWFAGLDSLRAGFESQHPASYAAVVHAVIQMLSTTLTDRVRPDPEQIFQIETGSMYSGTLIFVVCSTGNTSLAQWIVTIDYGSCSACDTLAAIRSDTETPPTADQVSAYVMLALHILQGLRPLEHTPAI